MALLWALPDACHPERSPSRPRICLGTLPSRTVDLRYLPNSTGRAREQGSHSLYWTEQSKGIGVGAQREG